MKDPLVLAIDQGTTGSTVLLIDARGRVRGRGYAELPQHFPKPGWVEHDGGEIWHSVLTAIDRALARARVRRPQIAAIGITNQRETVLLWDRVTGRPVGRAIVWQDRRTADRCAALQRRGLEADVRRRTGLVLDPYFSATKLEWMFQNTQGLRARARRGRLAFGTVDAWLLWKLTAGRVHATDPTNASRTLLYHIGKRRWDERLLDLFGVPASVMPRVMTSSGEFGRTHGVPLLPDGIPVAGIAGDQQAALFGQGCVTAGRSKNTYGTGCFLLLHTGRERIASRAGLLTTVACGPRGEPAYALEGSVFIAGAAIQWLRDGLGILANAAESESHARSVPDNAGVYFVPAFVGLGTPYWEPEARGTITGLTRGTTRAHLVRAALESMAYSSTELLRTMAQAGRLQVPVLRVDGGASANDWLMQFQADVMGIPVERPDLVETTALGAAGLAGLGVGLWRTREEFLSGRKFTRFEPRMSPPDRESALEAWHRSVDAALAWARGPSGSQQRTRGSS
jgi:glycerol kinase